VPAGVADAVLGAAREALRNVDRHAGADEVALRLDDGPRPRVTISDDGAGFDPASADGSAGIAGSIVGRMASVGGTATVGSAPGGGTTVTLTWEPDEPEPGPAPTGRVALLVAATGDVRRPLYAVTVGYLAIMAMVALLQPGQVPQARWFLLWYAVVCALTVLLIVRSRTGVGPVPALAAAAFAVGGAVLSVVVVPYEDLLTFASWPVGAVTPLLTVLVIVRPSPEALLAVLAEQVGIVLVLALGPMAGTAVGDVVLFALPMLVSPALGTLMGALLGVTIRRLGRATIEANARRAAVDAGAAADRVRRTVRDRRIAALHEEVRPFLASVAAGTDDPVTRRATATALEMAIRDELHLPGVLDRELRAAVDAARATGCRVVLQTAAGVRFDPGLVAALLRPVLGGTPPGEIVLGLHDDAGATTASLVVVPGRELAPPDGARVTMRDVTPEYAWVEVVVSA
ncbi:MAG: ATP-binding protein, partial [Pseudonocardia sediminis]